ncbi:MAG TPA: (5-formylfuran-3-yl)methyl phosphate synthase [Pirellulales bacterium]|jgi:uncharacterized protein (UPF0264 family)|nr:(5-formylfuran-3-yl)methyl phosphate synthase [Pirellulales bacterium]
MTRLLVSVRSVAEAREALAAGVDLIDFKEPDRGPLGAVASLLAAEMALAVGGRVPVSMACGELRDLGVATEGEACASTAVPPGTAYAKLGLADCAALADWPRRWACWIESLPAGTAPAAVIYADWQKTSAPAPDEVLRHATALGCRAVLIDTANKSAGDLLDYLCVEDLRRFVADARDRRMLSVLAGSLSWRRLPRVLDVRPDYVAVRGAVCGGSRHQSVDGVLLRQWVDRVRQGPAPAAVERR